jgi:hypothetical protein
MPVAVNELDVDVEAQVSLLSAHFAAASPPLTPLHA